MPIPVFWMDLGTPVYLVWNPEWIPDFVFVQSFEFDTLVTNINIGPERRRARRTLSVGIFKLNFSNISKALSTSIYSFYIDSRGPFRPFQWTNPVDGITYTVRFLENSLKREEIGEDLMNMEVTLRQLL